MRLVTHLSTSFTHKHSLRRLASLSGHPTGLRHKLGDEVGIERLAAPFAAHTAILHSTQRRLGQCQAEMVDADHSGLDTASNVFGGPNRTGAHVRGQAIWQRVGTRQSLLSATEFRYRHDGS